MYSSSCCCFQNHWWCQWHPALLPGVTAGNTQATTPTHQGQGFGTSVSASVSQRGQPWCCVHLPPSRPHLPPVIPSQPSDDPFATQAAARTHAITQKAAATHTPPTSPTYPPLKCGCRRVARVGEVPPAPGKRVATTPSAQGEEKGSTESPAFCNNGGDLAANSNTVARAVCQALRLAACYSVRLCHC